MDSFIKTIEEYTVDFDCEESYLNCRLEYIEWLKDGSNIVKDTTFLEFIQYELYDKIKCHVLSIESVSNNLTTLGAAGFNPYNGLYADISVDNNVTFSTNTGTTTNDFDIDSSSWNVYNDYGSGTAVISFNTTLASEQPMGIARMEVAAEEEKEGEPPEDPIESRWEILDFKGEDHANL